MPKVLPRLALQAADREEIERWVRAHGTPQQIMLRSHIVLAAADGQSDSAIAQALAVNRKTVTLSGTVCERGSRVCGTWLRGAAASRATGPRRFNRSWMRRCRQPRQG